MVKRKSKTETILKQHYRDMLDLNKKFIEAISRPRSNTIPVPQNPSQTRRRLSKKQLKALADGRKKLASKRSKNPPI